MVEYAFFGISISTLANLGVAVGTVLLAYYTYKSVMASQAQVEMSRLSIEKPRIVENIQNTLNSIEPELNQELKAINEKDLFWTIPNERNNFYMAALVFPLSHLKFFYDNFLSIFQGPVIKRNTELSTRIYSVSLNLKKRHEIYQNIDQNLQTLVKEIEQSHFDKRLEVLFADNTRHFLKTEKSAIGTPETFVYDPVEVTRIPKNNVDVIVKSMIISTIFKPLKKDEFRITGLGFSTLTGELNDKIPEFLAKDPIPKADEVKNSIDGLLNSLKTLDKNMLKDIRRIKEIYREVYTLKESELNPPQDFV